jgi:hypothetical protein
VLSLCPSLSFSPQILGEGELKRPPRHLEMFSTFRLGKFCHMGFYLLPMVFVCLFVFAGLGLNTALPFKLRCPRPFVYILFLR